LRSTPRSRAKPIPRVASSRSSRPRGGGTQTGRSDLTGRCCRR
jgi:hypothetical protein